ncbi:triose-phosphate isomerase TPI-II [Cardiosporidium cionae]|uniref:Triose-phosphate isomerase TPI-II n=1 Tax=Cardiosporidium cionae TaxID=476202 RepID=A0ABQ7J846_9APIC|nr:triose-phosphate isomerase TPI-II [Cardiosporidium cionae]|eukprot:KAF8820144.1 triose-phosphate isomerase TPI-II [Cardiosporidium cionae]
MGLRSSSSLFVATNQSGRLLLFLFLCAAFVALEHNEAAGMQSNKFSGFSQHDMSAPILLTEKLPFMIRKSVGAPLSSSTNAPLTSSAWNMQVEPSVVTSYGTGDSITAKDPSTPISFGKSSATSSPLAFQKSAAIPRLQNHGEETFLQPALRFRCTSASETSFGLQNSAAVSRLGATSRKPLIGGNWKCHGTPSLSNQIVQLLNEAWPTISAKETVDVVVAPPSLYALSVEKNLETDIKVATQDVGINSGYGAFTGELSADMIKDSGLEWCIVGHSERRKGFGMEGETNAVVAHKVKAAVGKDLNVILCVGEQLEDRQSGITMEVVSQQLLAVQKEIPNSKWKNIVIAYEPVWAIGTGMTATPDVAQETHKDIRQWLSTHLGNEFAENIRILYGGSVKGKNAKELVLQKDIDGFLVGGASISSDFIAILKATTEATTATSPIPV